MLLGSNTMDSSTPKEYHDDSREHPDEGFMVNSSLTGVSYVDQQQRQQQQPQQQQQQQQPKTHHKHKRTVSWDIDDPKSTMVHDLSPKSVLSDNKKPPPVKPTLLPPIHPNGLSHPLSNTNNRNDEKKEIEMSHHDTRNNSNKKETTPTTSKTTHSRKLTVGDLLSVDAYSSNLISPAAEAEAHIMNALEKQAQHHHHRKDSPWNMEVSVQTAGSKDSEMTAHTYDSPRKTNTPDDQPKPKPAMTANDNDDGSLALSSSFTSQSHPTVTANNIQPTLMDFIPVAAHPTPALEDEAEATLIRVLDKREQDRRDEVETAGVKTSSPAATMEEMIRPQLSLINELSLPQPPMPPSRPPRGRMAANGHTNNGGAHIGPQTNYLERLTLSKRQLTGASTSSISTNKTQITRLPSNEGDDNQSIHNGTSPTAARRPSSSHRAPSPVLPRLQHTPATRDLFVANAGMIYRRRGSHVSAITDDDIDSQKTKRPSVIAEGDDDDDDDDDEEKQMPGRNDAIFRSSFQRDKKRPGGKYKRGVHWLAKYNSEVLKEVFIPKMESVKQYVKYVFFVVLVPLLTAASLLFYVFGNPKPMDTSGTYSWWLIFAVRQVCTLTLSKASEIIFIDICSLRTRICTILWGPFITLMIAQARGWPYVLTLWALWDFAILYGKGPFAAHWGYWQDWVAMCNANNPAGVILYHEMYGKVLISAIVVGSLTAIKRVLFGMWIGQRTYKNYGKELEKIKEKMDILKEVAQLAYEINENLSDSIIQRTFEHAASGRLQPRQLTSSNASNIDDDDDNDDERSDNRSESDGSDAADDENVEVEYIQEKLGRAAAARSKSQRTLNTIVTNKVEEMHASANMVSSDRLKIQSLIGEWEEPHIRQAGIELIAIENVLEFYNVLSYMSHHYPFSFAFGPANTRDACISSAENVYSTLLRFTPDEGNLPFETLSLVALDKSGNIVDSKIRSLTKLFRPRRSKAYSHDHRLIVTLIDFIKACDYVYKKLRMFRAAVANESQIDRALEKIVNGAFYFLLGIILLAIFRVNAFAILVSVSGLIVSFAFMIGNSASKYFDGLLFILVRRPFDIGDRIAVSGVQENTSPDGSSGWIVEEVSLFTTTVRFGTTNEVATYANGSLANSRIINMRRSPKAAVRILMKFGIDTHYEKIQVFRSAVVSFVKERPNEWISLDGFRATRVEADLGFIEYAIVLTHFESWQNIVAILQSKSQLNSYCLEVAKKLGMRYVAPPLPVNLELMKGQQQELQQQSMDGETMTAAMAKNAAVLSKTPELIDLSQFSTINDFFKPIIEKKK